MFTIVAGIVAVFLGMTYLGLKFIKQEEGEEQKVETYKAERLCYNCMTFVSFRVPVGEPRDKVELGVVCPNCQNSLRR